MRLSGIWIARKCAIKGADTALKKLDGDAFDRARAVIGPLHQRASAGQRGLFYFDESGFRPNQPIKYGWSLIGQVRSVKPRAHRQRVNVPGVLRQDGKPV